VGHLKEQANREEREREVVEHELKHWPPQPQKNTPTKTNPKNLPTNVFF